MKSKKDKIIVAVTGVALTVVFLVAFIIGDASGLKVDDPSVESSEKVADNDDDATSNTSEGEQDNNETSGDQVADNGDASTDPSSENASSDEKPSEDDNSGEEETTKPPVTEPEIFLVNLSDFVYVRESASKESKILGKVYAGGGGEVIEKAGEWTKIKSGNVEGYVFSEYIWTGDEAKAKLPTHGKKIGTITTTDLRIREGASTSSDVLGYLDLNDEVEIIEEGEKWHKIKYEGDDAYIAAEYVKIRYEYNLGVTVAEEEAIKKAEEERLAAIKAEEERKKKEQEELLAQAVAQSKPIEVVMSPASTDISDEEIYLMMCVVSKECGHDVYEGQLAVANVILNRYRGNKEINPKITIRDILYAKNQFSVVTYDSFQKVIEEGPLPSARKAVEEALSGVNNIPNYANYRSLTGIDADDYAKMEEYSIIGNQVFYRRK
ncbi:MAG: SH3 domain-containing protein [Lachnospiraceae bacterium]|nr:SH3 domain-containing protein [Lachnospiraceae bacterium]